MLRRAATVFALVLPLALAAGCKEHLSVTPEHGTYTGGDTVTVHSNGLFPKGAPELMVYFGKKRCPNVVVLSEDEAQVVTPTGESDSTVDVEIALPDGRRFAIPQAFKFVDTSAGNVWGTKGDGGATKK